MCGNQVFTPVPVSGPSAPTMATFEPLDAPPNFKSDPVTALNAHIEALVAFKDTATATLLKTTSESVLFILTAVRDEMVEEDLFVELAEISGRTLHVLKHVAGQEATNLSNLGAELESFGRIVRAIESAIRVRAGRARDSHESQPGSAEEHAIVWRVELRELLGVFEGALRQCDILGKHVQSFADVGLSAHASSTSSPAPSASELLPPPSPQETGRPPQSSFTLDSCEQALQRLINGDLPQDERATVIESIYSSQEATNIIGRLREKDAQTFIDIVHEALGTLNFAPQIRRRHLKVLYRACARHTLLPKSLRIELTDTSTSPPLRGGGFGDVWKREHLGQEVAVKMLRKHPDSDLRKITRRFCKEAITWKALRHQNVLPLLGVAMSGTEFAMVSEWMPNGDINRFVEKHLDVNRFELLGDVARGLIYMHEQGMIHGDLKGANVLIDADKHARLADFGLLTIISDTSSASFTPGGSWRWMSPELFDPGSSGPTAGCPTKRSDCYALGMVIYEVLSGKMPFSLDHNNLVVVKILRGERPRRPRGAIGTWFTNEVWAVLESCWKHTPRDRPRIGDVLQCLEDASRTWIPASQTAPDPPAGDLESSTDDSSNDSEPSSLSQGDPSHSPQGQSEGDPDKSNIRLSAHEFSVLHDNTYHPEDGASTKSTARSDSKESVGTLKGVFQIKLGKRSATICFFFFQRLENM